MCFFFIHLLHVSFNHGGHWGTRDDFKTSFLQFSLFSPARWDLANSRSVHSLVLSPHLFLCLPCLLPAFAVLSEMVLARPDERETCPHRFSLSFFTMVRRSLHRTLKSKILKLTNNLTLALPVFYSLRYSNPYRVILTCSKNINQKLGIRTLTRLLQLFLSKVNGYIMVAINGLTTTPLKVK